MHLNIPIFLNPPETEIFEGENVSLSQRAYWQNMAIYGFTELRLIINSHINFRL